MKNKILVALVTLSLSSCALLEGKKQDPVVSYLPGAPKVNIQEFFKGDLSSFAIVQDGNGKIIKSYTSVIEGEWEEGKGVVKKKFTYNNGQSDSRTWLITDNKDGTFDAVGHDMAEAARGKQVGNSVQMLYALFVKKDGVKKTVRFEDSYYLVNEDSMIATSIARSKDGKVISKSTISLKKEKNSKKSAKVKMKKVKKAMSLKKPEVKKLEEIQVDES